MPPHGNEPPPMYQASYGSGDAVPPSYTDRDNTGMSTEIVLFYLKIHILYGVGLLVGDGQHFLSDEMTLCSFSMTSGPAIFHLLIS